MNVSRDYLDTIEEALFEAQNWLVGLIDPNALGESDRQILEFIESAAEAVRARKGK